MLKPLCDQMCGVPFSDLKKSSDGTDTEKVPTTSISLWGAQTVSSFIPFVQGGWVIFRESGSAAFHGSVILWKMLSAEAKQSHESVICGHSPQEREISYFTESFCCILYLQGILFSLVLN